MVARTADLSKGSCVAEAVVPTRPGEVELARQLDEHRRRYEMPEAEATADEAVARFPDSVDISIAYGRILLLTYKAEEAAQVFLRAEQLAPQNDRPAAWRVAALSRQRLFDEAIEAGIKATERLPNSSLVRVALGRVFLDSSRPEQASEHFAQAAAREPHDMSAINWHAAGLAELHRWAEAQTVIRKAIERDPAETELYFQMGWILIGDDCSREAVEYFDTVLKRAPQHPRALEWRITALRNLRRFSEAEEATVGAIRLLPRCPRLYVEHAWVSSDQDREDEAVTRVDRALAIDPRHSWALRSRMNFLQWARRFEEAEQTATEAIERCPDDPDILTAAAWVASSHDHYDEAVTRVDRVLAIDPRHSWALRSRILILQAARRFEEAEQAATEAIERRPDDPDIHTTAARVASDQDREDEAVTRVDRALAIDPRHLWALRSRMDFLRWARRFSEAEETATEAIEHRPNDPDILTAAAWVASGQDHYDEAVTRVDRALAIDPRHSWALRSRMDFLRWARRFSEAEETATEAIERRPDDPEIHVTAAWVAGGQDHYDKAAARVDRALAIDPRHSWALHYRIHILQAARRFEEAELAATEAIERRPDDPDTHVTAAWVASEQDHYDKAAARVDRALAIDPRHSWALRSRISLLQVARRYEEAEQAAAEAIELSPEDSGIRVELGRIKDYRREFEPALLCLAIVLARDPDHIEANVAKSAVLRSMRRCTEAQREITRLSKLKPKVRELKFELGQIHHDERRLVEARRAFRDLLDTAANADERAEAHHSLGWVAFTETDFITAEQEFRAAIEQQPGDLDYELALAWALTRQGGRRREDEAEQIATKVVERRPDPSAQVCLGSSYIQAWRPRCLGISLEPRTSNRPLARQPH